MMDTSKDDDMEIASSSGSRRYDVFPSFRGEDVRDSFLSHLLKELRGKAITFIDDKIERSRPIAPELLSAIKESTIAIVIFSKNYASSTWCLNELVEIHKCYTNLNQMVIPIFFHVDASEVKKQTGEFGKVFEETCEAKSEDEKQSWKQALAAVAVMAGYDIRKWPSEAAMIEELAEDVLRKTMTPSDDFGDFVGIEDHIEAIKSVLCLESKEARMVGIWGQSGIGKSTIGRALYSQLSIQFHHRAFLTYKSTSGSDVSGMKLSWEKELLSEILGQKDIKIEHFGVVEQRLKHKKVLILLDDVDNLEFLKTLVGKAEWFGSGSRIIVITQDRQFLKAHDIDLVYEVKLPSQGLALTMLCRSAFGKDSPPDDFRDLAAKVAKLAGNLPLGLSVLGSSLKRRSKEEWMEMLAELQNGLNRDIMKTLRVSYVRLDPKDQDIFHYIAWLFNGWKVKSIKDFLGDAVNVNIRLKTLHDKSLIRITPYKIVEMHTLVEKLATEIDREESKGNPGNRRFLKNNEEILDVFSDKTGTEKLLGIYFSASTDSQIDKLFISIDENSFQGMLNLQYLDVHDHSWWQPRETRMRLPNGLVYLPRKLKWLWWDNYPLKRLPSNFKAEYLVELRMQNSDLEKLWDGTQPLGSLKQMILRGSKYLKEIPDLSLAINLERLDLAGCLNLRNYFNFQNCFKLDRDARELILRSCFKKTMVLPGGEVPAYFKHRAYGNSVNITLPRRSLSHKFLRFNACVVVEPQTDSYGSVYVYFQYKGGRYIHRITTDMTLMCKTDHLVLCSFKFRQFKNTLYPKVKVLDNVEFKFKGSRIKGCGVRLLHVSPYANDSDGSSKAEYNQQSGEKCDAVETESSKKRMRMTLEKSEEDFNLPCGQTVTDTGLTAPNLELPSGRGESSSVSYPCLEGEAFSVDSTITKQQAKEIPIAHRDEDSKASWSSGSSSSSSLVPF